MEKKKFKLKAGDLVQVIAGKDKGKQGKIVSVLTKNDRVVVQGVNKVKRHTKPSQQNPQGGILEKEIPIHVSNVMIVDPKTGKPSRIGAKKSTEAKGKGAAWVRVAKKSGTVIADAAK